MTSSNAVFVAIDMSKSTWLVAAHTPKDERTGQHKVAWQRYRSITLNHPASTEQTGSQCGFCSFSHCCFEAGYDGFWLARRVPAEKIEPYVIDPTSGAGKPPARICEGEAEWPSYSTATVPTNFG